jgi:hypothetical protein
LKQIRWSRHAEANLADREIPRTEAEKALAEPELVVPAGPARQFFTRRYFDQRLQQDMLVRALLEETADERIVITVYSTSKIGKYMSRPEP